MARITGRDRMIDSVQELADGHCSEAVLVQQRPRWLLVAFLAVFAAVFAFAVAFDLPQILVGALAGGVSAGVMGFFVKMFVVARVDGDVVLARSSKLWAKAVIIDWRRPAPIDVRWDGGVLTKRLTIDADTYVINRNFVPRAESILN